MRVRKWVNVDGGKRVKSRKFYKASMVLPVKDKSPALQLSTGLQKFKI